MADIISKISLPGESNSYDLKDNSGTLSEHKHNYTHMQPLASKVYESTSYYATGANDHAKSSFFFMSVRPDAWDTQWRIKFKVHTTLPTHAGYENTTWSTYSGRRDAIIYANWNEGINNAHYYIASCLLKSAGYTAGYGHAIGINLIYASNYTSSGWYRTFAVDLLECEGCTVTFTNSAVLIANWTGYNSTNYNGIGNSDAVSRGLQESGDANTVTENRIGYFAGKTGTRGIWATQLFMEDVNNTYQGICCAADGTITSSNRTTATTKIANPTGFKVGGTIWYSNTTYNANTDISGGSVVYSAISVFDTRFSFNTTLTANSLTPYKPIYLVGTINLIDNLFYLDSQWWTQTPTNQEKVYILVGACYDSTTSYCRATLYEQNIWYRYDGTKLVEISMAPATQSSMGLMSAADKAKLDGMSGNLAEGANIDLTTSNGTTTISLEDTVTTGEIITDEAQVGDLVVTGNSRFVNTINGDISGNSVTVGGYTIGTTTVGSASAGTAIPADDITGWTTNTPTVVTKKTVVTGGSKTSIPNISKKTVVTGGSKTSIPNISKKTVVTSVTKKTVVTSATFNDVVTGGETTDIPNISKKTVVTSATFNNVVTGGSTTNIPNISKKTVVTSASGATASYANGILTITNGSFGTGDSVTVGTPIAAYTTLNTGASGSATTGDSVTVGTPIAAYTSLDTGAAGSASTGDSVTVATGDSVTVGTPIEAYTTLTTGDSVTVGTPIEAYTSLTTGDSVTVTPGTAASLSYTAKSIPNISVTNKTVATATAAT